MVPFGGWEMPLYYTATGILAEHRAVREGVGMFDVSHMGVLSVSGPGAAWLLARRTVTDAHRLRPGQCRYSFLLNDEGKIHDDLLVSRLDSQETPREFLVVPNAATAPRIREILLQHRPRETRIEMLNGDTAMVAVQGPRSRAAVESALGLPLPPLRFYTGAFVPSPFPLPVPPDPDPLRARLAREVWVSRTGYTGELGFEILVPAPGAPELWRRLGAAGAVPCGLGSRDTLRMEKGYLLSGVDFQTDRTPLEAGQERFVDFDHPFVGRPALEAQRTRGDYARWSGILFEDPTAIPRHGAPLFHGGRDVGSVSSGGLSPTLGRGIALAYLPPGLTAPGTGLTATLRGREVTGTVVPLPFVPGRPSPTGPTPPRSGLG